MNKVREIINRAWYDAIIVLIKWHFMATPIAEQLNNMLMRRQNLFVDIFVSFSDHSFVMIKIVEINSEQVNILM
jgi:hypothetical protein